MDYRQNLASALRKARGERSQGEMAKALGLEQGTYSRYESGDRMPGADVLYQVAMRLGITMEELLLGRPGEPPGGGAMKEQSGSYGESITVEVLRLMTPEGLSRIGEDVIKQLAGAELERKKKLLELFKAIGEELFRRETNPDAEAARLAGLQAAKKAAEGEREKR